MDLNELFFRHQIAVMRAGYARDTEERGDLVAQADWLAVRIDTLQQRFGAVATPLAQVLAA